MEIDYPEDLEEADILNTLHASINSTKTTIRRYQQKQKALKVQMVLLAVFVKAVDPTVTTDLDVSLTSELFVKCMLVQIYQSDWRRHINNSLTTSMYTNVMDLDGSYIVYNR